MSTPIFEPAAEILQEPEWLVNSGWGTHRAGHRRLSSSQLAVRLFRMPGGQRAPWHGSGGWPEMDEPFPPVGADSIYLAVSGEVDFHAGGREFRMRPFDMLLINAVVYSYFNPGFEDARFWVLNRRGVDWSRQPAAYGESEMVRWRGDPSAPLMVGSHPYYDAEPPPQPDALQRIRLRPWEEYRRSPITWTGEWGSTWGAYPFVDVALKARFLRVPAGQVAHREGAQHDITFIGVTDTPLSVDIDGQNYSVSREDVLMVPPGSDFKLVNPGEGEVLLFELWPNLDLAGD